MEEKILLRTRHDGVEIFSRKRILLTDHVNRIAFHCIKSVQILIHKQFQKFMAIKHDFIMLSSLSISHQNCLVASSGLYVSLSSFFSSPRFLFLSLPLTLSLCLSFFPSKSLFFILVIKHTKIVIKFRSVQLLLL